MRHARRRRAQRVVVAARHADDVGALAGDRRNPRAGDVASRKMVAASPADRAARATARPWLPALAQTSVVTPASSPRSASRCTAKSHAEALEGRQTEARGLVLQPERADAEGLRQRAAAPQAASWAPGAL